MLELRRRTNEVEPSGKQYRYETRMRVSESFIDALAKGIFTAATIIVGLAAVDSIKKLEK